MIGQQIQNYQITALIGEGGMGTVYRATDLALGRLVALKMLHTPLLNQVQFLDRFKKEARVLAQLQHPNIAGIYNFIEQAGCYFMIMEYVEGKSLDLLLRQHQKLSYTWVVPLFIQVLEGLGHAHNKGVFHRDIKPSNIVLGQDGTAKLMDFGIAIMAGEQRMTQVNKLVGTIEYLAPELIQGKEPSTASDLFAAGVTLYELLTGQLPFGGKTDFHLMQKILKEQPVAVNKIEPSVPKVLAGMVAKALEKNPANRFADAKAFQKELLHAFPYLREVALDAFNTPHEIPVTRLVSQDPTAVSSNQHSEGENTGEQGWSNTVNWLPPSWQWLFNISLWKGFFLGFLLLLIIWIGFALFSTQQDKKSPEKPTSSTTIEMASGTQYKDPSEALPETSGQQLQVRTDPLLENALDPAEPESSVPEQDFGKPRKAPLKKAIQASESPPAIKPLEANLKQADSLTTPEAAPDMTAGVTATISINTLITVELYLGESFDPATAEKGQTIIFHVIKPVVYKGTTIVERNAIATGQITNIRRKKISLHLIEVEGIGGQKLPLASSFPLLNGLSDRRIDNLQNNREYKATLKLGTVIKL